MDSRPLEQEVQKLRQENEFLRQRLEGIEARAELAQKARTRLLRGGFRFLVPLLDRQRVVRSFGKLTETASGYAGPPSQWPSRDEVLLHTRDFMESVVRFVIRRRMIVLIFSLLATTIPAIQIWLVFQQNKIIENQNKFAEIQVFDVVSRSMTEGDRNARTITGALLANADLDFLSNVVAEAFDRNAFALYRREGLDASVRRAKDTAFRGNLIRATVRVVDKQLEEGAEPDAVLAQLRPLFVRVLNDSEFRLAEVIRTGRGETALSGELLEEVDMYIGQIGELLKKYGRLARSTGSTRQFYQDIHPLLARVSRLNSLKESTFASTYRIVMQDFLFEVADGLTLRDGPFQLDQREPDPVLKKAIERLRKTLGDKALSWEKFRSQVSG